MLAVIGGTALSRRMTRPLRDIADLAGEIAEGNWNRQVPLRGGAEVAAVTGALNEMTRSLNHWQAEAMQRTRQLEAAYERYATVVNSARCHHLCHEQRRRDSVEPRRRDHSWSQRSGGRWPAVALVRRHQCQGGLGADDCRGDRPRGCRANHSRAKVCGVVAARFRSSARWPRGMAMARRSLPR